MQSTSIKKIYSNVNTIITGEKTTKLIIDNIYYICLYIVKILTIQQYFPFS